MSNNLTYTINSNTTIESNSYCISNLYELETFLEKIKDNTNYEIDPYSIRSLTLTLHSNSIFKYTKNENGLGYIGIDTLNQDDKDLKHRILLGKRNYNNLKIFNPLENTDSDIYFYNTKKDSLNQDETKLSFLAGISHTTNNLAPYISTVYLSDEYQLSLNFVNKNGNININSNEVYINEILFPEGNQNIQLNNKCLVMKPNNTLQWEELNKSLGNNIGNIEQELELNGSTNLNGHPLVFSDGRKVPIDFGGLDYGESFDNYPLIETIKKIIYTYQPPNCDLKVLPPYENGNLEIGSIPNVSMLFTINKKTLFTLTTALQNMIPGSYPPIESDYFESVSEQANAILTLPIINGSKIFKIIVNDGITQVEKTIEMEGIYPIFIKIKNPISGNYIFEEKYLSSIEPFFEEIIDGEGIIEIYIPYEYPNLEDIMINQNNVTSNFQGSSIIHTSPNGYWSNIPYYKYISSSSMITINSKITINFH